MRSPLPWADRPTRWLLLALPLLAVLLLAPSRAFACGETAAEITYCVHSGLESGESIKHSEPKPATTPHHPGPKTSRTSGEEPTETATEPEPHSGEGHKSQAPPPAKGGNQPPGGGKSGNHASPPHQSTAHQDPGKAATPKSEAPTTKGVQASASSGGSSPVLPILVAIVVLAAISIGVVVYRERKGGDGEAGYTGARG